MLFIIITFSNVDFPRETFLCVGSIICCVCGNDGCGFVFVVVCLCVGGLEVFVEVRRRREIP